MLFSHDQRKLESTACALAEAMVRHHGTEAARLCREALGRRELYGVRRSLTGLALQILEGVRSATGSSGEAASAVKVRAQRRHTLGHA